MSITGKHLLHLLLAVCKKDDILLESKLEPDKLRYEFNTTFKKKAKLVPNKGQSFIIEGNITYQIMERYGLNVKTKYFYVISYLNKEFIIETIQCTYEHSEEPIFSRESCEHVSIKKLNLLEFIEEYQAMIADIMDHFGCKSVIDIIYKHKNAIIKLR